MRRLEQSDAGTRWSYAMLVDDVCVGCFFCESYGVSVTDPVTGEVEEIRHVTTDTRRALELLSTLARCEVTPATLRDVVEDWLGR